MGARIALRGGFLPQWVGRMRETAPDIPIRSEISFEEDPVRRLIAGTLRALAAAEQAKVEAEARGAQIV